MVTSYILIVLSDSNSFSQFCGYYGSRVSDVVLRACLRICPLACSCICSLVCSCAGSLRGSPRGSLRGSLRGPLLWEGTLGGGKSRCRKVEIVSGVSWGLNGSRL